MGTFANYSKRKFKVSMVLFARMSWPWKAALTKTLQKSHSLPESIFPSHPQWEFISALISISYSAVALSTAQVSGVLWEAGHGAGGRAVAEQVGLPWWSCDTSPCTAEPCWAGQVSAEYLHMDLVQLLLAWKAVGGRQLLSASSVHSPAHTPGSSDSGSKSWYVAGAFWHLRYFHALYNLCKLKCQGVINYVAVHSLHFIYKNWAQDWEQEGTNLGNNIAEEFTQKYYVIY